VEKKMGKAVLFTVPGLIFFLVLPFLLLQALCHARATNNQWLAARPAQGTAAFATPM